MTTVGLLREQGWVETCRVKIKGRGRGISLEERKAALRREGR